MTLLAKSCPLQGILVFSADKRLLLQNNDCDDTFTKAIPLGTLGIGMRVARLVPFFRTACDRTTFTNGLRGSQTGLSLPSPSANFRPISESGMPNTSRGIAAAITSSTTATCSRCFSTHSTAA